MSILFLTGFMGSGKSTVAALLSQWMHVPCVDMDQELSTQFGCSIHDYFQLHGEAAFRQQETALLKTLSHAGSAIVATGGGLPVSEENRRIMKACGTVCLLEADFDTIADRIRHETADRPKWSSPDDARRLFFERQQAYHDCDVCISAEQPPEDVAIDILQAVIHPSPFWETVDDKNIPVVPSFHPEASLKQYLASRPVPYSAVVFLTDSHVGALHLKRYLEAVPQGISIVITPGESSKTLEQAQNVYRQLIELHIGRDALIVAIGGGVVTDFAAFVASTYKRGIDYLLISTSLLGCVDAVIGGKTAVNIDHYKNQVGLFSNPTEIYLDLQALITLPAGQRREGLIEAYKTGLVCEPSLETIIASSMIEQLLGDCRLLADIAIRSAHAKASVVRQDYRENGLRKILNLGHTYGHAIEAWSQETVSHGLSVAQGTIVAVRLAERRQLVPADWAAERIHHLEVLRGPSFDVPTAKDAWPFMQSDKKNTNAKITFILPVFKAPCQLVQDISEQELQAAIDSLT